MSEEGGAQACDTLISRTGLAQLAGREINSITVVTAPPTRLPGVMGKLSGVHVVTRESVIRRDLLFAPGQTIDTSRVAESLRRLRHRQYLAEAGVEGFSCANNSAVDLVVRTRDRWTTKPKLSVQSTSSFVGIQEDDLFGSGNSGSLSFALREGKLGGAVGYESFRFPGNSLAGKFRAAIYPDGNDLRARFRNQEHSVFDTWRGELIVSGYVRDSKDNPDKAFQSFHRRTALASSGRRYGNSPVHVDRVLFGADAERAELNAPDRAPVVGPHLVKRDYKGLKAGVSRHAAAFDTVSWLIEKQILVDIPIGFEWEMLAGAGREGVTSKPATFLTGWAGKMWMHNPEKLSQLDLWGSGYLIAGRHNWDAANVRAAYSKYKRAGYGVWSAHILAEKLVNPDPDVRALSNLDVSAFAVKRPYRFAEEAYAASVQQTGHVTDLTKSFSLDVAGFFAGSLRRKSPFSQTDHVTVGVVGVGLLVIPRLPGSGTIRLDAMYPFLHSRVTERKVVFALSLSPWLEASRHREDPRLRQ
ncbi:MAG: hypothetical protein H0W63_01770 [Gemmatimonadaceae bacterium]|nr:hypothetical protein [Gemmatimonadaceae bacterium]